MIKKLISTNFSILTKAILSLFLVSSFNIFLTAQATQTEFGKNRVQFHKFTWFEYETDNFNVYWYGDGKQIGITAAQLAEWDYSEIQEILEHRISRKIGILVFTDITDLKQSNIGNEEAFVNSGGQTKIMENKIFVHFNGDHNDLRRQVREGIADIYMQNMMFGTNIQEVVQNAVLLNLPEWFSKGIVGYAGLKWSTELDNQLGDIFASGKYENFEAFAQENPKLAGHSLWYYIDNNYGRSTTSNLIYLTRINRSVESGFLYVLGSPYRRVLKNWHEYFSERYKINGRNDALPPDSLKIDIRNKRKIPISNAKLSPDGKKIAYAFNEKGKIKVFVHDLVDGKRKMVFKTGFRNKIQATDYNYPLLAWSPNNQNLGILYEKRDIVKFLQLNINNNEKIEQEFAPQYQRVYSIDYMNSNDLLISGSIKGFSDIFIYHINQRSTDRITNDFYDDLDPTFVNLNGKKGILFSSNRGDQLALGQHELDSILPIGNYDIYYHDLENDEATEFVRITNTPEANESHPMELDSYNYAFVSDKNGVNNRYIGELEEYISHHERVVLLKSGDEIILHQDSMPEIDENLLDTTYVRAIMKWRGANFPSSNYKKGIIEASSISSGKTVENFLHNGINNLYVSDIDPKQKTSLLNSEYRQQVLKIKAEKIKIKEKEKEIEEKPKEKPSSWEFDSGFGDVPSEEAVTPDEGKENVVEVSEKEPDFVFITDYIEEMDEDLEQTKPGSKPKEEPKDDSEIIDIENYEFESDFDPEKTDAAVIVEDDNGRVTLQSPNIAYAKEVYKVPEKRVHRYNSSKLLPHRLKFKANSITTQVDNGLLFGGLERYTGSPYSAPPLGIFFKSSVQDLFEDYELEGGIRIPTTFSGLEYYVTFKDERKRLDKSYSYYRKSTKYSSTGFVQELSAKDISNLVQTDLKYALDIYGSLRARASLRIDKFEFLSKDQFSLEIPAITSQRIGLRLEYVFDNTIDVDLNLKNGARLKVYSEVLKKMDINTNDGFNFNFNKGVLFLAGADIRHYQRLGKHTIFATRFAGATSFGSEKMLFFLGGVDNELFPTTNQDIPLPTATDEFAYQTLASPIRGFRTNIRNGNSFLLANVELRIPLFKYFYKRPIKSSLIRNFQIVGFFDVGTAWQGTSPFSQDNPLNTSVFAAPPNTPQVITATVNYYRDPIVAGFGAGVRTKIFGYFIRVDYGKGLETKILQPGIWHVSLGTDF